MRRPACFFLLVLLAGCQAQPAPPVADGRDFSTGFDDTHEMPGWDNYGGRWELWDEPTAPSQPHALQQLQELPLPAMYVGSPLGTFGSAEVKVAFRLLEGTAMGAGVVVRFADPAHYYVVWSEGPGGVVRMEEHDDGNVTELGRSSRSFESGAWTILTVRAQGDQFRVSVDSDLAFTAHDATLSVGKVGLWMPAGARAQFDDLAIERL